MATRRSIGGATLVLRLVHAALAVSLGIYVLVLYLMFQQPPPNPPQTFEHLATMFYILAAVAAGTLVAIPVVRSLMLPRRLPPQQRDERLDDETRSRAASQALQKLFAASIVSWAMAESAAMYGLVLSFMMREMWPYFAFGAPALAAMLLAMPRRSLVEAVVRAADAGPGENRHG